MALLRFEIRDKEETNVPILRRIWMRLQGASMSACVLAVTFEATPKTDSKTSKIGTLVSSSSLNGVAKSPAQDFKIKILARQEGSDGVQYAGAVWPNPRTLSQILYRHLQGEALIWISPTISPQYNFCMSKNLIKAFLCLIKPNPIEWFTKAFNQVTMSVFEWKSRAKAGQTEEQGNGNRKETGTAMTLDATLKTYHGPNLERVCIHPMQGVLAMDGHTKNRVIKEQYPLA